jgi:predicted O-methyltransferase YrrM
VGEAIAWLSFPLYRRSPFGDLEIKKTLRVGIHLTQPTSAARTRAGKGNGSYPMNPVLAEIFRTKRTLDETGAYRTVREAMSEAEGELIVRMFEMVKPDTSLEVGFACGVSALFACTALERNQKPSRHIVIDPMQTSEFRGAGLTSIKRAGFSRFIDFVEAPSELALPQLLREDTRIQAAIIDGLHTFDHALVDFFYINKMLDVGGVVIFDDVNMPAIARLIAHITTYPAYRLLAGTPMPRAPNFLVSLRRALNGTGRSARHSRDNPTCVALQKTTTDARQWDWHTNF